MRLLLRPKPMLGESWPGYLLRLAEANAYRGVTSLSKGLGKSLRALFTTAPVEILQMLEIALPEDVVQPSQNKSRRKPCLFLSGRPLNSKVCSQCLHEMETPYLKSDWDRAFAFKCREHGIPLTDTCHGCGTRLTYLRTHVASCNCGFRLSNTPTFPLEPSIYGILDVLNLRNSYAKVTSTFGCSEQQDLEAQRLVHWFSRLDAGVFGQRACINRQSQAHVSLDEVRAVSHWFDNWPKAFIKRVLEVHLDTRYPVIRMTFGSGTISPLWFPMIERALDAHIIIQRSAVKPRKNVGLETAILNSSEFVNLRFLRTTTGCSHETVRHWLFKGWLGEVQTGRSERSLMQYRISREAASKAIQLIRSTASTQEMAKTIGMKVRPLRDLIRHGVLQGLPYGKAEWDKRVVPEEVFRLTTQLFAAAKRGIYLNGPRILFECGIVRLQISHPDLVVPFVEAVLNKKIPTRFFLTRHPTRLDQISLREADFLSWRKKVVGGK